MTATLDLRNNRLYIHATTRDEIRKQYDHDYYLVSSKPSRQMLQYVGNEVYFSHGDWIMPLGMGERTISTLQALPDFTEHTPIKRGRR